MKEVRLELGGGSKGCRRLRVYKVKMGLKRCTTLCVLLYVHYFMCTTFCALFVHCFTALFGALIYVYCFMCTTSCALLLCLNHALLYVP